MFTVAFDAQVHAAVAIDRFRCTRRLMVYRNSTQLDAELS